MSLELFVRGLYTCTAVARHPCFSWAFLYINIVPDTLMFYCRCLLFVFICFTIRSLRSLGQSPWNKTLPDDWYLGFIMQFPKYRSTPRKKLGPKTCQIWGDF